MWTTINGDKVSKSNGVKMQKIAQIIKEALCDREPMFCLGLLVLGLHAGDIIVIFVQR